MGSYNVEQLVSECVIEKLGEIYQKDEEYKRLLKEEEFIYEKLSNKLMEEQTEELKHYLEAVNATSARRDRLAYIQGMKDMYCMSMIFQDKKI
ncbi:MAG: hypothetical protein K2N87_18945 [Eubacterium sp.]|nr:hypothetical protein [Eubacterium sp.]